MTGKSHDIFPLNALRSWGFFVGTSGYVSLPGADSWLPATLCVSPQMFFEVFLEGCAGIAGLLSCGVWMGWWGRPGKPEVTVVLFLTSVMKRDPPGTTDIFQGLVSPPPVQQKGKEN